MHSLVLVAITGLAAVCHGANILMLEPMPTKSHYHLFDKLAIQLTKRGHKVTLLSPFKQSRIIPNLTEIVFENNYEAIMASISKSPEKKDIRTNVVSPWWTVFMLPQFGQLTAKKLLESSVIQEFLEKDHKFDVLIAENFLIESATAGLAFKFNVPIIAVTPFMPNYWTNYLMGNPSAPSFVPDPLLGYSGAMNFFQRFCNTAYLFIQMLNIHFIHIPNQDSIMKEHFGPKTPYILDILKNTSLALVNHHFSLAHPSPQLPNMIEIGGYHVPPPGQLPQDLQKIMDESKHGVILFSMGSHLKSEQMPKKMVQDILNAFSRLKQTVLWKYEDDSLENRPKNLIIRKWLPQSDILAHPNLKLFITHGGLLSTVEALYNEVPLVGIPVLGDQPLNMRHASNAGYAVTLSIFELDADNLYAAITEVLNNPKYAQNVKKVARLLRDRPMKPMDAAVYWIEYVIRHNGAPHLRSLGQDLTWYQIQLLDVFAVFSVIVLTFVFLIYLLVRLLRKALCGSSTRNKTPKHNSSSKKRN